MDEESREVFGLSRKVRGLQYLYRRCQRMGGGIHPHGIIVGLGAQSAHHAHFP